MKNSCGVTGSADNATVNNTAVNNTTEEGKQMKQVLGKTMLGALAFVASCAFAGYADDRAEIENLSNKYMVAVDAGDIDTVMSTWAEDGVLEWVFGIERGKEA